MANDQTIEKLQFAKMDDYYYQGGDYTICRAGGGLLPFAVYCKDQLISNHKLFAEAMAAADEHHAKKLTEVSA